MSGKSSTFAVIDLNRAVRGPTSPNKSPDALWLALDKLMKHDCQVVSVDNLRGRFQATIQFDSVGECLEAVGEFARASFSASRLTLPARIGIATGESSDQTRAQDHPAYRRARWLSGLASEPAILVSDVTAFLSRDLDLHPYGIEEYGNFYSVEVGESATVYCLIHPQIASPRKRGDDSLRHNVPDLDLFFLGRIEELEAITGLLERRQRVVSLIGVSGVGKTTIARRIGWGMAESYPDGVKYADLSRAKDRHDILVKIFKSIDLPIDHLPRISLELLRRHFGDRRHLLILDGCDHVAKHLAPIVSALLETKHVQILTTSVRPLDLSEDPPFRVEDFPLPPASGINTIAELQKIDACALLIDGILRYRQGLPPSDADVPEIVELVRAVFGNPFAIYLASRRLRTQTLREIINSNKDVKWQSHERNPAVQLTFESFDKTAQNALEHAAMFVDPWPRNNLAEMMEIAAADLTQVLRDLELSGLITEIANELERSLYVLNPHFRNEILLALSLDGRLDQFREKHFFFFRNHFSGQFDQLDGPNQRIYLDLMDQARGDLEASHRFVIETNDDPAFFILSMQDNWFFWYKRNRLMTVISLAETALAKYCKGNEVAQVRFLSLQAIFLTKVGRAGEAIPLLERAVSLLRRLKEPMLKSQVLVNLAMAYRAEEMPQKAIDAYEKARALSDRLDKKGLSASICAGLVSALIDIKDLSQAERALGELEQLISDSEDPYDAWNFQLGSAEYWCERGDTRKARVCAALALKAARAIGDVTMTGKVLLWASQIEFQAGDTHKSAIYLGGCLCHLNSGEHAPLKVNLTKISNLNALLLNKIGAETLNRLKMQGYIDVDSLV
jgi:tetratricopeptide (TPR) repeat protein